MDFERPPSVNRTVTVTPCWRRNTHRTTLHFFTHTSVWRSKALCRIFFRLISIATAEPADNTDPELPFLSAVWTSRGSSMLSARAARSNSQRTRRLDLSHGVCRNNRVVEQNTLVIPLIYTPFVQIMKLFRMVEKAIQMKDYVTPGETLPMVFEIKITSNKDTTILKQT